MEEPTIEGGCDSVIQKSFGAVFVLVAILLCWYVMTFVADKKILLAEHMCGGIDQMCKCAGNESFVPLPL